MSLEEHHTCKRSRNTKLMILETSKDKCEALI
jgi:hypothetical protein